MEQLTSVKTEALTLIGVIGSFLTSLLGGWDTALQTLLLFMAIDYIMGLTVAGVFRKSSKTDTGALESLAGWKGLIKKGVTLGIVMIGVQLDILMGMEVIRYGVIIAFVSNELISIIENAGLMGVHIPSPIMKVLDMLKDETKGAGQ